MTRRGSASRECLRYVASRPSPHHLMIARDATGGSSRGPHEDSSVTKVHFHALRCLRHHRRHSTKLSSTKPNKRAQRSWRRSNSTQPNATQPNPTQPNPIIPFPAFHLSCLDVLGLVEGIVEKELACELGVRSVSDCLRAADLAEA